MNRATALHQLGDLEDRLAPGDRAICRQLDIVDWFHRHDHDACAAESLLLLFEGMQSTNVVRRQALLLELEGIDDDPLPIDLLNPRQRPRQ